MANILVKLMNCAFMPISRVDLGLSPDDLRSTHMISLTQWLVRHSVHNYSVCIETEFEISAHSFPPDFDVIKKWL